MQKGTGPASIPNLILTHMPKELASPLSIIANISFASGIHPDKLKIAKVIPIFRKGSKLIPANYRPISLLSNINKIIEKLVFPGFSTSWKTTRFYTNSNMVSDPNTQLIML